MRPGIAYQLYSARDDAEKDFFGTLTRLKKMGYAGVELAGLYGKSPSEIGRMISEAGLTAVSAHVPFADMRADMGKVLEDYKTIGVKHIAVPYLCECDRPEGGNFAQTVADIRRFAEMAKKEGITLSYHNHDFEFAVIEGVYALDLLYSSIPSDLLCAELDTCWVRVAGEDPAAYIKKYASRSPLVHLKDYSGKKTGKVYGLIGIEDRGETDGAFEYRALGHGVQDMKAIVKAAEEAEVEWMIVEQDEPTPGMTRLECAELSREWLASIGY